MNCKGPFLVEGFLYNLSPFFDNAFAQLGVITRTRNKFAEIAAVSECYLIVNSRKRNKNIPLRIYFPVKPADGRMSMQKEKISSYLIFKLSV